MLSHKNDHFRSKTEGVSTLIGNETPVGLANRWGSWADARTIDCHLRYVKTIGERYTGKVKYWFTFNEINVLGMAPSTTATGSIICGPTLNRWKRPSTRTVCP